MTRRRHPMNVRFAQIHSQLGLFLASRACLLRWLVAREEVPWIESALADGIRGARVVCLTAPFEHPQAHGYVLGQELLTKLSPFASATGAWRAPTIAPGTADVVALARFAESFAQVCAARGERLVLELDPSVIADVRAYLRWTERVLATLAR